MEYMRNALTNLVRHLEQANIKDVLKGVGIRGMNEMYIGPVMRYFEHGDERSGTINVRTFETR